MAAVAQSSLYVVIVPGSFIVANIHQERRQSKHQAARSRLSDTKTSLPRKFLLHLYSLQVAIMDEHNMFAIGMSGFDMNGANMTSTSMIDNNNITTNNMTAGSAVTAIIAAYARVRFLRNRFRPHRSQYEAYRASVELEDQVRARHDRESRDRTNDAWLEFQPLRRPLSSGAPAWFRPTPIAHAEVQSNPGAEGVMIFQQHVNDLDLLRTHFLQIRNTFAVMIQLYPDTEHSQDLERMRQSSCGHLTEAGKILPALL